jgi:transcriptional regulator with XRE-family HTH domain
MQLAQNRLIELIMEALRKKRGQLAKISRESGVPYDTLAKIAQGKIKNPGIENVQHLMDYFGIVVLMPDELKRYIQPELVP